MQDWSLNSDERECEKRLKAVMLANNRAALIGETHVSKIGNIMAGDKIELAENGVGGEYEGWATGVVVDFTFDGLPARAAVVESWKALEPPNPRRLYPPALYRI